LPVITNDTAAHSVASTTYSQVQLVVHTRRLTPSCRSLSVPLGRFTAAAAPPARLAWPTILDANQSSVSCSCQPMREPHPLLPAPALNRAHLGVAPTAVQMGHGRRPGHRLRVHVCVRDRVEAIVAPSTQTTPNAADGMMATCAGPHMHTQTTQQAALLGAALTRRPMPRCLPAGSGASASTSSDCVPGARGVAL
jgi:hypothetical protein